MQNDTNILVIFDDEYEKLPTEYQIEEISDTPPCSMAGGGGGGGNVIKIRKV